MLVLQVILCLLFSFRFCFADFKEKFRNYHVSFAVMPLTRAHGLPEKDVTYGQAIYVL